MIGVLLQFFASGYICHSCCSEEPGGESVSSLDRVSFMQMEWHSIVQAWPHCMCGNGAGTVLEAGYGIF